MLRNAMGVGGGVASIQKKVLQRFTVQRYEGWGSVKFPEKSIA